MVRCGVGTASELLNGLRDTLHILSRGDKYYLCISSYIVLGQLDSGGAGKRTAAAAAASFQKKYEEHKWANDELTIKSRNCVSAHTQYVPIHT